VGAAVQASAEATAIAAAVHPIALNRRPTQARAYGPKLWPSLSAED
jgi:hypothetical protein